MMKSITLNQQEIYTNYHFAKTIIDIKDNLFIRTSDTVYVTLNFHKYLICVQIREFMNFTKIKCANS